VIASVPRENSFAKSLANWNRLPNDPEPELEPDAYPDPDADSGFANSELLLSDSELVRSDSELLFMESVSELVLMELFELE
jgi:hypothetical protein